MLHFKMSLQMAYYIGFLTDCDIICMSVNYGHYIRVHSIIEQLFFSGKSTELP